MKWLIRLLLAAFVLSGFLFAPSAQAQNRLGPIGQKVADDFQRNTGVKPTGDLANDLIKALDAKLLPDLQYALKLAQATGSKVTAPCWQAWIDIINTQQKAVANADGTEIPAPDPHLITSFERMVELRNAMQPDSDFMLKCSPVASMVKKDIASFMGIVISGGAGIATLIPGL
jgi:hypothetical protein